MPTPNEPGDSPWLRYAKYSAVAYEFIGSILAGVFLGSALDAWLGSKPWMVLSMTIVGTAIGFYRMVQLLRRFQRTR